MYHRSRPQIVRDLSGEAAQNQTLGIKPDFRNQRREDMQAYCVKCKEKREVKDPVAVTMKNGKPATQGTCSVCGTKMFKIGKAE